MLGGALSREPAVPNAVGGRSAGYSLHVVVGAAGASGRLVVQHLREAGHRVRAVTRDGRPVGGPGVEQTTADATDLASLERACAGAQVVYHCAMPPIDRWLEVFPVMTDTLIEAAAAAGARLVYADDTWMYGRVDQPMTEETPDRPVSRHGVLRAWLAERIRHAAAAGRLPVSIVRAGELYGPGVRSMVAANVFAAARRGRSVHWLGDPDLPLTPTYIDDFARTLVAVGAGDQSTGAIWHVPHPEPTTGRELAAEACRQSGTRLRLFRHGSIRLRALGRVVPLAGEAAELVYQFEQPFVVDGRRAAAAFDLTPTPYPTGVAATLASLGR